MGKTPEEWNELSQILKNVTVGAALTAEINEHLGYRKHQQSTSTNNRNGKSSKQAKIEDVEFELDTLREREVSFGSKLVKKHQTCYVHGR